MAATKATYLAAKTKHACLVGPRPAVREPLGGVWQGSGLVEGLPLALAHLQVTPWQLRQNQPWGADHRACISMRGRENAMQSKLLLAFDDCRATAEPLRWAARLGLGARAWPVDSSFRRYVYCLFKKQPSSKPAVL